MRFHKKDGNKVVADCNLLFLNKYYMASQLVDVAQELGEPRISLSSIFLCLFSSISFCVCITLPETLSYDLLLCKEKPWIPYRLCPCPEMILMAP